jgi:hypothetical protein
MLRSLLGYSTTRKEFDMRLADIALVNIPGSREGSTLRGTRRLLRDLVSAGLMQEEHPSASERLERKLGGTLTRVVFATLDSGPDSHGVRPRRAA